MQMLCLAPEDITISDGEYVKPFSTCSLCTTASLSEPKPDTGEYLVKLSSMAASAASFINWGVCKSGSPTAKSITETPREVNSRLLRDISKVADGDKLLILEDKT